MVIECNIYENTFTSGFSGEVGLKRLLTKEVTNEFGKTTIELHVTFSIDLILL